MPDPNATKKFEQNLIALSGKTPNWFRERLREASTNLESKASSAQEIVPSPVSNRFPPLPGSNGQKFEPRAFGSAPQNSSSGGGGGEDSGLPSGSTGDILYYDGSDWVLLAAPTAPASAIDDPVLRHNGTAPYWDTPDDACP